MAYCGVRWNTVTCAALRAISGIACTPDEPVPMTPTRLPAKVDRLVRPVAGVVALAGEAVQPGMSGLLAADRVPTAQIRNWALTRSPVLVSTVQRCAASSYCAP